MSWTRPERHTTGGRAVVTGCAGFVGSHLCERLVDEGWSVLGIDCFTPFYPREIKLGNLARLREIPSFELLELDLSGDPLAGLTEGADAIFHLAGQPGARQSFGAGVEPSVRNNLEGTARLLGEALATRPGIFVFASSSTIYGDAVMLPTPETAPLRPLSPYGHTKVAAERLVGRFAEAGLATTILRYFSCYGPRQRPDMALSRSIAGISARRPVPINGDGLQRRDFTYVGDVVEATVLAARRASPGSVYNVGGGESVALLDAVRTVGAMLGAEPRLELRPAAPGDARETRADGAAAACDLGFVPRTPFAEGLAVQVAWSARAGNGAAPGAGLGTGTAGTLPTGAA